MKVSNAIERLNKLPLPIKTVDDCDNHKAVQLGIEALKRLQEHRNEHIDISHRNLPGETPGGGV